MIKHLLSFVKKHRCWQRFIENKCDEHYKEYCKYRNQVRNITRKKYRDYERNIASQIKVNPKKFWSYVKSKTKSHTGVSSLKHSVPNPDGTILNTLVEDDLDKANVLADFFSSVLVKEDTPSPPF